MYRLLFISFCCCLLCQSLFAQRTRHHISGFIKEANSSETLIGATLYSLYDSTGTTTNVDGFYTFSTEADSVLLKVRYVGYEPLLRTIVFNQRDTTINFELEIVKSFKEVVVESNGNRQQLEDAQMSVEEITAKEAKEVSALMGEADIIKLLQLKPGVQASVEGSSGLYVRGGRSDQNLFLLDGATLYNPSHLLGLFSTFNADAVKNVQLYKGSFPTRFGGRLSSVLNVQLREGNRKEFKLSGGLGLIAARLLAEGPIRKGKSSFLVAGRSSYAHPLLHALNEGNRDNPRWTALPEYHFYDLNLKANIELSPKDRLFLSAYSGNDNISYHLNLVNFDLKFNLGWTNQAAILRWNRLLSPNAFLNTSASYTRYNNQVQTKYRGVFFTLRSDIQDAQIKSDLTVALNNQHTFRTGFNGTYHFFEVGRLSVESDDDAPSLNFERGTLFPAAAWSVYASDEWRISPKLSMAFGLRFNNFHVENTWHTGLAPRWNLRYLPHKNIAIKASYMRSYQFMHLMAPGASMLPTDLWYPSTKNVMPQFSDLAAAGLSIALGKDYYINIEGYYKWMHQQIEFKNGARIFVHKRLDEEFIRGHGWSYGSEFYLEKKTGALRGWIGYTLSWTWRQFPRINGGQEFHPQNDRRHDISAVVLWNLPFTGPKFPITLSASWVYGSGKAISLPRSRYIHTDITGTNLFQFIPLYNERGNYRLPANHRLDLGLVWKLYPLSIKRLKSDLTVSVYNVYDRRNAFFMYINPVYSETSNQFPDRLEGRLVSLFPIIPSVTWNFYW